MQIKDVYSKEYTCRCGKKVQYGKVTDNDGNFITEDGQAPNGKLGKDDNRLSAAVDVGTTNLHGCNAKNVTDKYNRLSQPSLGDGAINSGKTSSKPDVDWKDINHGETPLQKELREGYEEINSLAYQLTVKQHPGISDQDNVFGQIVHAKSLVLTNLLIAKNLKKLREQYNLAHKLE